MEPEDTSAPIIPIPQRLSAMAIGPIGAMRDDNGEISAAQVISWKYNGLAQFRQVGTSPDLTPVYNEDEVLVSGMEWLSSDIPVPTEEEISQWRTEYQAHLDEQLAISRQRWGDFRGKLWGNADVMRKTMTTAQSNGYTLLLACFSNPTKETCRAFAMAFQMVRAGLPEDFTDEELQYVVDSAKECDIPLTLKDIAIQRQPDTKTESV